MAKSRSKQIAIRLPEALLKRVDVLAAKEFASRSDIIRQALLGYISKPENQIHINHMINNDAQKAKPLTLPENDDGVVKINGIELYDPDLKAFLNEVGPLGDEV